MTTTERASYIAGLRTIADLLEENDEIPIPDSGQMTFHYLSVRDPKADLADFARVMPGPLHKVVWGGTDDAPDYFDLRGNVHGVRVTATAYRANVCTRVVVGTREVVEEVPDPAALAAVPTVSVVKTVEDVQWDCGSLLAPREAVSA